MVVMFTASWSLRKVMQDAVTVAEIEQNLARYKQELARVIEKYGYASHVTSIKADSVARNYALVGQQAEAQKFFRMAADIGLEILEDRLQPRTRCDHRGDAYIALARYLWRAEDPRAVRYWRKALEQYQRCHESSNERIRHHALLWSIYPLLFLGSYATARQIAATVQELEEQSDLTYSNSPAPMLQAVAAALEKGSPKAAQEGVEVAEDYLRRIEYKVLYTGNTMPYADVYELVKRERDRWQSPQEDHG